MRLKLRPTLGIALLAACGAGAAAAANDLSQEELERITAEVKTEVEELRGEKFQQPVAVAITDAAGFREYVKKRIDAMMTPEELAAEEELAKLLGLVPADYPLLEKTIDLVESQVGGFYDPGDKRFYLMSSFTGGLARMILAHELTHALDDQLYDLDKNFEMRKSNTDALWAYQALAEGSGTRVMSAWVMSNMESLDASELADMSKLGLDELADAPPYLWKPLIGAYTKGEAFLAGAPDDLGLAQTLRDAFGAPPRSSEQVLHPDKYWNAEERDEPVAVEFDHAGLPEGWEVLKEDTLGEIYLALLVEPLDKRRGIDNPMAAGFARMTWKAADGWGGDRALLLGRGDADRLLVLATTWDREKDAKEFEAAIEEQRAHLEADGKTLRVAREGSRVHVVIARGPSEEERAKLIESALSWSRFP